MQATEIAEFIKRMTDLGYNLIPGTPEDMAAMKPGGDRRAGRRSQSLRAKVD